MDTAVRDLGDEALRRGDWDAARLHFDEALEHDPDDAAALEGRSWVAWWQGDVPAIFDLRERAFRAHRADGDLTGAARMAAWLASAYVSSRGDLAVARGWLRRARQLLEGVGPSDAHGWIGVIEADLELMREGDVAAARACAEQVLAVAHEIGSADLETIATAILGCADVTAGRVGEGLQQLEDASASALGEEYEHALAPGWALCYTVHACTTIGDLPRAMQWCGTLATLVDRWESSLFFGTCRSAYGQVLATRGEWTAAEDALEHAVQVLTPLNPGVSGVGRVRLGELRARQGRTDEARALFEAARPHPGALLGLGSLALEEGDHAAAADAAERVLRRIDDEDLLMRVDPLELLVAARAAAGDGAGAGEACEALRSVASTLGTPYLAARAALACATAALTGGDLERARRSAEDAVDGFAGCHAPYDTARARLALAGILAAAGRDESASAEAEAAADVFARLGATRDQQAARAAVSQELADTPTPTATPPGSDATAAALAELSPRELEVLRLVARGLSDPRIAEELVVSPHTVHRHVANIRTKLRLPSRAAAVAWAASHDVL